LKIYVRESYYNLEYLYIEFFKIKIEQKIPLAKIWSYVNYINGERQILFWFILQFFLFVGSLVQRSGGNERDFNRGQGKAKGPFVWLTRVGMGKYT